MSHVIQLLSSHSLVMIFVSTYSIPSLGAFIPGVPVQPVVMRYPNKMVSDCDCNLTLIYFTALPKGKLHELSVSQVLFSLFYDVSRFSSY